MHGGLDVHKQALLDGAVQVLDLAQLVADCRIESPKGYLRGCKVREPAWTPRELRALVHALRSVPGAVRDPDLAGSEVVKGCVEHDLVAELVEVARVGAGGAWADVRYPNGTVARAVALPELVVPSAEAEMASPDDGGVG